MKHVNKTRIILIIGLGLSCIVSTAVFAVSLRDIFSTPQANINLPTSVELKKWNSGISVRNQIKFTPLELLDILPALAPVKEELLDVQATNLVTGEAKDGLAFLRELFEVQKFKPTDNYLANKQKIDAMFANYAFYDPWHTETTILDRAFIINTATSLYTRSERKTKWSIDNYSDSDIRYVFLNKNFLYRDHSQDYIPEMPNLAAYSFQEYSHLIEPAQYQQYGLAQKINANSRTQVEAVKKVIAWMEKNFFHANDSFGWDVYLDGREPRPNGEASAIPLTLSRLYDERVIGCQEAAILMEGILHNLNIPAIRVTGHGHGIVYLPSLNKYIHGDHIAMQTVANPDDLLISPEALREFLNYDDDYDSWRMITRSVPSLPVAFPLNRVNRSLVIRSENNFVSFDDHHCAALNNADWRRVRSQLSEYNVRYNNQTCAVSSSAVRIRTLGQLN